MTDQRLTMMILARRYPHLGLRVDSTLDDVDGILSHYHAPARRERHADAVILACAFLLAAVIVAGALCLGGMLV